MAVACLNEPWYALRVRSKCEQLAVLNLQARGFAPFAPSYKKRHRWSDRVKVVELPLFPGYVFCRFDAQNRLPVLSAPGVIDIVSTGRTLAPIDDNEMQSVRALIVSGYPVAPCDFLTAGNRVRVVDGPLRGAEGVVDGASGRDRFVVAISLLQRAISVEFQAASLQRAS